jgi:hypothetical protein
MLTTVLNTLVLLRIVGLRLAHEAGWDGFGPLIIGLAIVGVLIGALSRARQNALAGNSWAAVFDLFATRPPE